MTSPSSRSQNLRLRKRVVSAATAAILGLTSVQVVAPEATLPSAAAAPRTVPGTSVRYDDQDPRSIPWDTTVVQNSYTRYSALATSLDAADKLAVKSDSGQVARVAPKTWGQDYQVNLSARTHSKYKTDYDSRTRPVPFQRNTIVTQIGTWENSVSSQDKQLSYTWRPAPGYIGYAPPLPVQQAGTEGNPQYDFLTSALPSAAGTRPLSSNGSMGQQQSAQALPAFGGLNKDGPGAQWQGWEPEFAFQIDSRDDIAAKTKDRPRYRTVNIERNTSGSLNYPGDYLGYVTNKFETPEGVYEIDPHDGEITFTPSNEFFTADDYANTAMKEKKAKPIRVIVSNLETTRFLGPNRVMDFGRTRPAHSMNDVSDSYRQVHTFYTPSVRKPNVVLRDADTTAQPGQTATLSPDFAQGDGESSIDLDSLRLIDPVDKQPKSQVKVLNEGTWKVLGSTGKVEFTPEPLFVGDPTPIVYTAKNTVGAAARPVTGDADNRTTLTAKYSTVEGRRATTVGKQGIAQRSDSKNPNNGDLGLTPREMFPGYPDDWYDKFEYQLVAPNGDVVKDNVALEVPGVGTYIMDKKSGVVTVSLEPGFTGAVPKVGIRIANLKSANGHKRGRDGDWQPYVISESVFLQPAAGNGKVGQPLQATPKFNPPESKPIDPKTVTIRKTKPEDTQDHPKHLKVAGEGEWVVNPQTGTFTFTPEPGFLGNPTSIRYDAKSTEVRENGRLVQAPIPAQQPGIVAMTYEVLGTTKAATYGTATETQTSEDNNSPADAGRTTAQLFPDLPASWYGTQGAPVSFTLIDASGTPTQKLDLPNVGEYTINPVTGVVSFTPVDGFLGGAASKAAAEVMIQTVGTRGNGRDSSLTASYQPFVEVASAAMPSITEKVSAIGQPGSATPNYRSYQIDPATVEFKAPAGTTLSEGAKKLTVPNQGTWTVNNAGTFTFTPVGGFNGSPTPVRYTAKTVAGQKASGSGQIALEYPVTGTQTATTVGFQGETQNSFDYDLGTGNAGKSPREMFPGLPTTWYGEPDSPVTFELEDPADPKKAGVTEITIEGQGTFTLDPVKGTVRFDALPTFTGKGHDLVIRTNGLKDADGKPAEQEAIYTPHVTPVAVALPSQFAQSHQLGAPLLIEPKYTTRNDKNLVDKNTIRIIAPEGTDLSEDGKTLTVPGQGTWTVDKQGNFTFSPQGPESPEGAFVTAPTPIYYTAKSVRGVQAETPALITALYPAMDPRDPNTTEDQGRVHTSSNTTGENNGLSAATMFPLLARHPEFSKFGYTLIDASGHETDTITLEGKGTFSINHANGVVSFTPLRTFHGTAGPVKIAPINVRPYLEDPEHPGELKKPTAYYTAFVKRVDVIAPDAAGNAKIGEPVTATPAYGEEAVLSSVQLVDRDGAELSEDAKTLTVPGQGEWKVDEHGTVTFIPAAGFYGSPTPVEYTVANKDEVRSNRGKVEAIYDPVVGVPVASTKEKNTPQTSPDGTVMFPDLAGLGPDWKFRYALKGDADQPGQGSYTIDENTGVVTFTPAPDFEGTTEGIDVVVSLGGKKVARTTYIPVVYGDVPVFAPVMGKGPTWRPVTMTAPLPGNVNPDTVKLVRGNDSGTTVSTEDGEWSVTVNKADRTATFTFKPSTDFTELKAGIEYTGTTDNGTGPAENGKVTVDFYDVAPILPRTTVAGPQGEAVTALPDYTVPGTDASTIKMLNALGHPVEDTSYTARGQGTWTVDEKGEFTFTPAEGFTSDPTPLRFIAYNRKGGARAVQPGVVAVQYTPELKNASSTHAHGDTAVVRPDYPANLDRKTVVFTDANTGVLSDDGRTLTVEGEGTWTVDTKSEPGAIRFVPEPNFTGNPTPVTYTATSRNSKQAAAPAQIRLTYTEKFQLHGDSRVGEVGRPVSITPAYPNNIDRKSLRFMRETPAGPVAVEGPVKIEGQGEWNVDSEGVFTFTPEKNFVGNPDPVHYTAQHTNGTKAEKPATLSVTYRGSDGQQAVTYGLEGEKQSSTDTVKADSDKGLTPREMFPGYPDDWYGAFTYGLVRPDGSLSDLNTYTIDNVGTYTLHEDGTVSFNPDRAFKNGAAPAIGVRITSLRTNGDRPKDGSYQAVVLANTVTVNPAYATGIVGQVLTAKPEFGPDVDPETVEFVAPRGLATENKGKKLVVPREGTWTVDDKGVFTFTPNAGFLGDPTPVSYHARTISSTADGTARSSRPAQVILKYVDIVQLIARSSETRGSIGITQTSDENNSGGDRGLAAAEMFPGLPKEWYGRGKSVGFRLVDANRTVIRGNRLDIENVGTYVLDPNTGIVTFTPSPNFLTPDSEESEKAAPKVGIQVTGLTATGKSQDLTGWYTPIVEKRTYPLPPASATAKQLGDEVRALPNYAASSIDPESVTLVTDIPGVSVENQGKKLVVPGQGTWTVHEKTGKFIFTPLNLFNGSPDPVEYTAKTIYGGTADGRGQVTVNYPTPTARPAITIAEQAEKQSSYDKGRGDYGLNPREMFPELPDTWFEDRHELRFELIDEHGKTAPPIDGKPTLIVPGVGTYQLDPADGEATFTPEPQFHGEAPNVGIRTRGLVDKHGDAVDITGHYQPIVTPKIFELPFTVKQAADAKTSLKASVRPDYTGEVDVSTIRINAPEGATLSESGKELVVPGEGTWSVDDTGEFTFAPQGPGAEGGAFIGSPKPITYSARNTAGIPATVPGTVTIYYPVEQAKEALSSGAQGTTQRSDDTEGRSVGLAPQEMFPMLAATEWWPNASFALRDRDGKLTNSITHEGEGTYTVDWNTGVVTFRPEKGFTGTAKPVDVTVRNVNNAPVGKYAALVTPVVVLAPNAVATGQVGENLVLAPSYDMEVNPSTVELVAPNNPGASLSNDSKTLTIPTQGTWTVDKRTGAFTFVPEEGFYGNPAPVAYTVANWDGVRSPQGSVAVNYTGLATSPAVSTGPVDTPQESKPLAEMFPFPATWTVDHVFPEADGATTLNRPEGTYTIADGRIRFTPAPGYTGTPEPVAVEAQTGLGEPTRTTYQVVVAGAAGAPGTATAPTAAPTTAPAPAKPSTSPARPTSTTPAPAPVTTSVTLPPTSVALPPTVVSGPAGETTTVTVTPSPVTLTPAPVTTTVAGTTTVINPGTVTYTPEPITTTVTHQAEPVTITPTVTVTPTVEVTATPPAPTPTEEKSSGGGSSTGNEAIDRCFNNAVRSPLLWLVPIGLLVAGVGALANPVVGGFQAQLDAMNAEIARRYPSNSPVAAANKQIQALAKDPAAQQIGAAAGVIIAMVAAGAVLYDWCAHPVGEAKTAIGG